MLNAFALTNNLYSLVAIQAMSQKNSSLTDLSKASFFNILKQSSQGRRSLSAEKRSKQFFGLDAARFFSSSSSSSDEGSQSENEIEAEDISGGTARSFDPMP